MIECLQNHTPDIIVVDEIGRKSEVEACRTVRQRGIRLIASAGPRAPAARGRSQAVVRDREGLVPVKEVRGVAGTQTGRGVLRVLGLDPASREPMGFGLDGEELIARSAIRAGVVEAVREGVDLVVGR